MKKATEEVKKILISSAALPPKMNHVQIYPEHLMLAIISHGDNKAMDIIRENIYGDVQDLYDKIYTYIAYTVIDPPVGMKSVNMHGTTIQIMDGAGKEAENLNENRV